MKILPAISLLIFFLAIILSLPVQNRLYRLLRDVYPDLYVSLGSPRMFSFGEFGYATPRFWIFILSRRHRSFGDKALSRLFDRLLALSVVALLAFVAMVAGSFHAGGI
ncbi:MAG TPA: hypothetical protein VM619_02640 [Luteimonas sp.]|nr:hypothetical protein [Luteimonas sp.]